MVGCFVKETKTIPRFSSLYYDIKTTASCVDMLYLVEPVKWTLSAAYVHALRPVKHKNSGYHAERNRLLFFSRFTATQAVILRTQHNTQE